VRLKLLEGESQSAVATDTAKAVLALIRRDLGSRACGAFACMAPMCTKFPRSKQGYFLSGSEFQWPIFNRSLLSIVKLSQVWVCELKVYELRETVSEFA
jgi:hypothetical protein